MPKEKLSYVFPNIMAKVMKKVDMRTQMESSMISIFMIMIGMTLMATYLILFGSGSWVYRGLILLNLGAAFIFISSFLVTTYQQYISYMEMAEIDPDKHKKEILKKGNIFKRIRLAYKNKKEIRSNPAPELIRDAVDNMIEIKKEELKEYKKIENKSNELREENDKKLKGGKNK